MAQQYDPLQHHPTDHRQATGWRNTAVNNRMSRYRKTATCTTRWDAASVNRCGPQRKVIRRKSCETAGRSDGVGVHATEKNPTVPQR
ncbi:MAG: hypothetical protein EGQ02_07480 [Enterobacter cloacae]|nr:hypothetical protein [Enterobacter cloacae]